MEPLRRCPAGYPMAPSQEVWDALTLEDRARVVDALPGTPTRAELARLEQLLEDVQRRADDEARGREEEARRREEAERELARLREELARLKR